MFTDRRHAGKQLSHSLSEFGGRNDVVVLALPRGGVPVAYEVARYLRAPLDVLIVRKIGVPGQEELAMGAIACGGTIIRNEEVIRHFRIGEAEFARVAAAEAREIERREKEYRGDLKALDLFDKTVLLIDDGIATGATMQAAAAAVRRSRPNAVIVAAPVIAPSVRSRFAEVADRVICLIEPGDFQAVGLWYEDFSQTTDEEVRDLLALSRKPAVKFWS